MKRQTCGRAKAKQHERIIPITLPPEIGKDANCDSEEDVKVVEEVCLYGKCPKGLVIGSFKSHPDISTHSSILRKRVKPDMNVVKCPMKRTNPSGCLRHFNSFNLRRRLFQMEQSIRLEERMNYLKLLQSMVTLNESIASVIKYSIHPSPSLMIQKSRLSSKPVRQNDVQIVDLTSDSECDVIDVDKINQDSKKELEELAKDHDVVVIPDELEEPGPSQAFDCIQRRSVVSPIITEASSESDQDEIIDLVEENEHSCEISELKDAYYPENKDPRGNLEKQMMRHMNIIDNAQEIIEVSDKAVDDDECIDEDLDDEKTILPKITEEMEILVFAAFRSKSNEILVEGFNLVLRHRDIHTLKGNRWLNDEIMNFYMCLLMERGKLPNYPSVYCFNTFFYVKLAESGHNSLKRWTRKVDIFSYDLIIIPIHLKVHWCLACINFPEKKIEYYDSMGGKNEMYCTVLMNYLREEHQDKKHETLDCSRWHMVNREDIPEQLNGSDCGVFVCTYAEYICRLAKLTFSQRDMPYFRVKMAYEILTKKLLL